VESEAGNFREVVDTVAEETKDTCNKYDISE
jgi:hypothetical protein